MLIPSAQEHKIAHKAHADLLDLLNRIQNVMPRIAIVGDQSVGKSSLVTSLTGIIFPRPSMASTRCAVEIRLRRSNTCQMNLWIEPDEDRPGNEKRALQDMHQEVEQGTPDEIQKYLHWATQRIVPVDQLGCGNAFTALKDKIIMEKSGPNLSPLTLIDLPGLVKFAPNVQEAEYIHASEALTDAYIIDHNTIILAVVSGNDDYMQARILSKAIITDRIRTRTIGDMAGSHSFAGLYR